MQNSEASGPSGPSGPSGLPPNPPFLSLNVPHGHWMAGRPTLLQSKGPGAVKREDDPLTLTAEEEAAIDEAIVEHSEEHYVKQVVSYVNCKHCSYTCNKRDRMVRHVKNVHLKEKPHVCSLCPASFGRKDKLKRHLDTVHSPIKPFKCQHCASAFNRKDKLRAHVQGVHFKIKPHPGAPGTPGASQEPYKLFDLQPQANL